MSMTGSANELNRGYFDDISELKQHGGKGISDLLSPILFVMKDESESFWCFLVELLDRPLHKYFEQNNCLNYFFCLHWILIHFKRYFCLAWSSLVLTLKACWLNKMNKFTVLRDLNFVAKNLGVEFFKGTLVV
ncbi:TBC1 domain family member 15 [Gossypium arboreum]|uniref:TBC1 domain family member 15 n=1 Tax=Gossypium arboreum TaxID=29729 RepID=A0A0B0MCI3_GOSAR|nr:TBC1 domain family member 15 [Gossypium arboreum]